MIAIDCETTGLDIRHGARPFFVTTCDEQGEQKHWCWDVDLLTRTPVIPEEDLQEIASLLSSDSLVGQNIKFDATALASVCTSLIWPWERTYDTLLAGHLLASNQPHDLTSMALQYLGVDIQPLEDALEQACNECRRLCRSNYPCWRIAKQDLPEMPSAKEKCWKFDTWLPRAIARAEGMLPNHPYWTVLQEYANADSAVTLALWCGRGSWHGMAEELRRRDLWSIYEERRKLLKISYMMEEHGVTVSEERLRFLQEEYRDESFLCGAACLDVSESLGYTLSMPKGASPNDSLRTFILNVLKCPPIRGKKSKTSTPSLDKEVMAHYSATLPEGDARTFIRALLGKRKIDTSLAYLDGYTRFWQRLDDVTKEWYVLHPSLNITGTDTLRWSSTNPNSQNISKQSDFEGHSLRYCFGPAPGREWWSFDAKNIELRIPAYEAGEEAMIALFEKPDEPPYFGSNHLLNFHTVYPDLWDEVLREVGFEKVGPACKKRYADTYYQWCKNGGFAVQYGAMDRSTGDGTGDRAFHRPGSHAKLKARFRALHGKGGLNERCIAFAERHGYIETIPDRTVNPRRGYPLLCTRTDWGKILPTVPLNYRVQGTAMWWMAKAMVRCQAQLDAWNSHPPGVYPGGGWKAEPSQYFMVLQVHDELVFDFPVGKGSEPWRTNLPKARKIQRLMAQGGDDIGIPTPVSCQYHAQSWSEGREV